MPGLPSRRCTVAAGADAGVAVPSGAVAAGADAGVAVPSGAVAAGADAGVAVPSGAVAAGADTGVAVEDGPEQASNTAKRRKPAIGNSFSTITYFQFPRRPKGRAPQITDLQL